MFAADLSWTDPTDIKVGERREKKSKKGQDSSSSSSKAPSVKSAKSTKRESTWRPATRASVAPSVSTIKPSKTSNAPSKPVVEDGPFELDGRRATKPSPNPLDLSLKDPTLHPAWTYSGSLSPRLPSGESFDIPDVIPDPSRRPWSRKSNSSGSQPSSKCTTQKRAELHGQSNQGDSPPQQRPPAKAPAKAPQHVIEDVYKIQQLSPKSFVPRSTGRSTEASVHNLPFGYARKLEPQQVCAAERTPVPPVTVQENVKYDRSAHSVEIEGVFDLSQFKLNDEKSGGEIAELTEDSPLDKMPDSAFVLKESAYLSNSSSPMLVTWKAPSEWDVNSPTLAEHRLSSVTALSVESTSDDLTHFQRFIRRMENAGPRIILDRLREEWHNVDEEADDELQLEKQLWVLTALQLQPLDKDSGSTPETPAQLLRLPPTNQPLGQKRRMLELYGNIAEVYQLSAMQAKEKIYYLSIKPQGAITLPANVSYLSVPQAGSVPFPYAANYFNHIRASSLPSLVPSAKLPQLFRECYRLLAPGGVLEIRLMDSCADRQTAGPLMRMWMEDRVSLNLEKSFRCSRPCMLVPTWVEEAGFSLKTKDSASTIQKLRIPTAVDLAEGTVNDELATLVGRALWKDVWGEFVDEVPGEPKWFWEDESIMNECLKRKTVIECCTLFAFKE